MGSERSDDIGAPTTDEEHGLLSSALTTENVRPKNMLIMPGPWPANPLQAMARSPHRSSRPPPDTPRYAYETPRMRFVSSVSAANDDHIAAAGQRQPPSADGTSAQEAVWPAETQRGLLPVLSPERIQTTTSLTSEFRLPLFPDAMPEISRVPLLPGVAAMRTASDAVSVSSDAALLPQRDDSYAVSSGLGRQLSQQTSQQLGDWPEVQFCRQVAPRNRIRTFTINVSPDNSNLHSIHVCNGVAYNDLQNPHSGTNFNTSSATCCGSCLSSSVACNLSAAGKAAHRKSAECAAAAVRGNSKGWRKCADATPAAGGDHGTRPHPHAVLASGVFFH